LNLIIWRFTLAASLCEENYGIIPTWAVSSEHIIKNVRESGPLQYILQYIWIYLAVISFIAIALTMRDKSAAKKHKWRTKESTLLIVSVLGGSVAMLLTMLAIRHKTKHAKFMLGIPVIIVLQIAAVLAFIWLRA